MARRDAHYQSWNPSDRQWMSQGQSRDLYGRNEEDNRYRNRSSDFRRNSQRDEPRRPFNNPGARNSSDRENRNWNDDPGYYSDRDRRFFTHEEEDDYSLRNSALDDDSSWSQRAENWENQDYHPNERSSGNPNRDFESEENWNNSQNRQDWNRDFNTRHTTGEGIGQRRRNRW